HSFEVYFLGGAEGLKPVDAFGYVAVVFFRIQKIDHDDFFQSRQLFYQLPHLRFARKWFSIVSITVGSKKRFRFDLFESVHDAVDAKIGRATRPYRAETTYSQKSNRRLRDIGQVSSHPVAFFDADFFQI